MPNDLDLKRDVENLLLQHESAGELLEDPLYGDTELSALEAFAYEDEDPLIGRGWAPIESSARSDAAAWAPSTKQSRVDNEFRLRVAIKLVKRGMDTDFVLRRFRKERQILAALDHPHIARLMDGGTTADGLPYFVMEFIEGQPLYRYCDAHQLTVAERLKLFRSLCDAVHYAHQKQVVHRDIKPSNVLVTSEGVPKLLDFGIAKLLNPALAGDITHDPTATAMRLMTPEYASPEQVQGAPATPTTDVYSLGVLLYELLTGHRPYRLVNRAPHEIARVICEEAPAPPSFIITRPEDLLPNSFVGNDATTLKQLFDSSGATLESLRRDLVRRPRHYRVAGSAKRAGMALSNCRATARGYHAFSRWFAGLRYARVAFRRCSSSDSSDSNRKFAGRVAAEIAGCAGRRPTQGRTIWEPVLPMH